MAAPIKASVCREPAARVPRCRTRRVRRRGQRSGRVVLSCRRAVLGDTGREPRARARGIRITVAEPVLLRAAGGPGQQRSRSHRVRAVLRRPGEEGVDDPGHDASASLVGARVQRVSRPAERGGAPRQGRRSPRHPTTRDPQPDRDPRGPTRPGVHDRRVPSGRGPHDRSARHREGPPVTEGLHPASRDDLGGRPVAASWYGRIAIPQPSSNLRGVILDAPRSRPGDLQSGSARAHGRSAKP